MAYKRNLSFPLAPTFEDDDKKKKKQKKTISRKFYESEMYAKHVGRYAARKKKKYEKMKAGGGGGRPLFDTPEGWKRYAARQDDKRRRKKDVKNWFKSGKQRRAIRKSNRQHEHRGGGWVCTPESC